MENEQTEGGFHLKRFTETAKWVDPWFRKLPPKGKLIWLWLCDNCDPCGVIDFDHELASFHIGLEVKESDILSFSGRVERMDNGKFLIVKFALFQYGKLSRDCKAHIPIFKALEKNGLTEEMLFHRVCHRVSIPYPEKLDTLQEKETETDRTRNGMEAHAHCNKPRWEEPTGQEFIEFFIPKLACLGHPLTLRDWLGQQYSWLASDQWPKGNKLKWKTLEFDFASRYRSRHAEVKSKNPAVPKATGFTPEDFINPMDEEVRKACGLPAGTKLRR